MPPTAVPSFFWIQSPENMKALIIGATGATGRDLVKVLLKDPDYTAIVLFVRHPTKLKDPKLFEIITDFDNLETVSQFVKGDVWFSCLGTTERAAGSQDKQWHIDYDIPLKFAEIAKQNGVPRAVLLSAYGANPTSPVFYSRMKGQLEDHIGHLSFGQYIILRPGALLRENTDRSAERISVGVLKLLNALGLARRHRPLPTSLLAEKLAKVPKMFSAGTHVIALDKIWDL